MDYAVIGISSDIDGTVARKYFEVEIPNGYLSAMESGDIDYPGIDIEFVADNEDENALSRPRVLFEYPTNGKLRVLIWDDDDKDNEDYTREIVFDFLGGNDNG